jgi:ABC-type glycerol-3-phosphate transport system permease component
MAGRSRTSGRQNADPSDNYVSIATSSRFWQMLGNSAFIAFVTVVLTLLISSMAAFMLDYLPAQKHIIAGLTAGAVKG